MSHPRPHQISERPSTSIREFFGQDIDRPLLIIGNGPSASTPRHDQLPDDPVVFRMNWFFLEDRMNYGSTVDAFFFSIPNAELESRLTTVVRERWYDVRALFSPMRIAVGRDGETHRSNFYETGVPEFDHWSVIAEHPAFARFMMSRPLPTQGMQVLATALILGFRDITLVGIDMYESTSSRYGYVVPDAVASALQSKDLTPGYEDSHSLDRDLDFLDACLGAFGEADIKHVGPSKHLANRLVAPATRSRPCTFGGVSASDFVARSKPTFGGEGGELRPDTTDDLPVAMIDGQRCGYVTFVSGPFHHGARALARSLSMVTDVPLLVMCAPSADRARMRASGLRCIDVPEIMNPNRLTNSTRRFAATYTKLHAFRMAHLDRAVYLDSDMVVLQSIDDLFNLDGFWAVPDHGLDYNYDRFNSGMFRFDPDPEGFDQLVGAIGSVGSYDSGDQGFLNEMFPNWKALPHEYNVNKRWSAHHPNAFRLEDTRVLHYVGIKPWQPEPNGPVDDLYHLWYSFLSADELIEVAESLRESASVVAEPRPRLLTRLLGRSRPRRRSTKPRAAWSSGSLLRRAQARTRDGAYDLSLQLLLDEWPGDSHASAGLHRELAKSYILNGRIDEGVGILRRAKEQFPMSRTVQRDLAIMQKVSLANKATFGVIPPEVIGRAARTLTGSG